MQQSVMKALTGTYLLLVCVLQKWLFMTFELSITNLVLSSICVPISLFFWFTIIRMGLPSAIFGLSLFGYSLQQQNYKNSNQVLRLKFKAILNYLHISLSNFTHSLAVQYHRALINKFKLATKKGKMEIVCPGNLADHNYTLFACSETPHCQITTTTTPQLDSKTTQCQADYINAI